MSGDEHHDSSMTRRDFLKRSAAVGASIAAAGAAAYWLRDRNVSAAGFVTLPDYSLPKLGPRMSIASGADRAASLRAGVDAVGGIGNFISPGDRVLLKVNAAFASPPLLGATTHPDVVAETASLCLAAGAKEVIVTDNPIYDPQSCFQTSGIADAARKAGAKVMLPKDGYFRATTVAGARFIRDWPILHTPLEGANKLIGICPVKHHQRAGASMCMKNWYGLLGGRRNKFHQDINGIITELAMMVRPTLVVLDGTAVMMTNGPTGGSLDDLRAANTMIVSTDQVAADAFGATLLGMKAADLPYIAAAAAAQLGTADYESLKPKRISA